MSPRPDGSTHNKVSIIRAEERCWDGCALCPPRSKRFPCCHERVSAQRRALDSRCGENDAGGSGGRWVLAQGSGAHQGGQPDPKSAGRGQRQAGVGGHRRAGGIGAGHADVRKSASRRLREKREELEEAMGPHFMDPTGPPQIGPSHQDASTLGPGSKFVDTAQPLVICFTSQSRRLARRWSAASCGPTREVPRSKRLAGCV